MRTSLIMQELSQTGDDSIFVNRVMRSLLVVAALFTMQDRIADPCLSPLTKIKYPLKQNNRAAHLRPYTIFSQPDQSRVHL